MHAGRWETMLFPDTRIMPNAGVEDPFLYIDQHTKVFASGNKHFRGTRACQPRF